MSAEHVFRNMSSWNHITDLFLISSDRNISRFHQGKGPLSVDQAKEEVIKSGCNILNLLAMRKLPSKSTRILLEDDTLFYFVLINEKDKLCLELNADHFDALDTKVTNTLAKHRF